MYNEDTRCSNCGVITPYAICISCGNVKWRTPPTTPPLVERLRKAQDELIALGEEIDNCTHDWVEGKPAFEEGDTAWVLRQPRDCQECGLHQERLNFTPRDGWEEWQ